MDRKSRIRRILNILTVVSVLGSWTYMALVAPERGLSSRGIASFKFYTVLSNFLAAISAAVFLAAEKRPGAGPFVEKFKFMGLVTVSLTFLVVLGFLGPLFTYRFVYSGAGFFMHLLVPVMCAAEYLFLTGYEHDMKSSIAPLAFTFLYGTVYLLNVIINGPGEYPNKNDFYSFTYWGMGIGMLIFAVICLLIILISFLYIVSYRKLHRKGTLR